jgi:hypothetical protein
MKWRMESQGLSVADGTENFRTTADPTCRFEAKPGGEESAAGNAKSFPRARRRISTLPK